MGTADILLIAFNRPHETVRVLSAIREYRPKRLFFAADAPRSNELSDVERCQEVRQIVCEGVDWPCELATLVHQKNRGCGEAVTSAIDWALSLTTEVVVLEDDCLPARPFFNFCERMLAKYRMDERVDSICGFNVFGSFGRANETPLSAFGGIWGWATWRRAWVKFKFSRNARYTEGDLKGILGPDESRIVRCFSLRRASLEWDQQWLVHRLRMGLLSVVPPRNLITNIGFSGGGTNTRKATSLAYTWRDQTFDTSVEFTEIDGAEYDRKSLEHYMDAVRRKLFRGPAMGAAKLSVLAVANALYSWILSKALSDGRHPLPSRVFQPVILRGKGAMSFGEGVIVGSGNSLGSFEGHTHIEARAEGSQIAIGCDVKADVNVRIIADSSTVTIGDRTILGREAEITDSDFGQTRLRHRREPHLTSAAVYIGSDVCIGPGVRVLKGTTIGNGSVVGAGSVVTSDIPAGCVAAGNPARVVKYLRE